ncbi:hypothetical protein RhiirA5_487068, partial [Rhizophagus irregularis]
PNSANYCLKLILFFSSSCVSTILPISLSSFCYPEGNFGRNQLLDGSISLLLLYPNLSINLHVRTASF